MSIIKDLTEINEGSFYIFYDKLQLVQYPRSAGDKQELPRLISEADCKLTLYRNCRNTQKIAISSASPVMEKPPLLMDPPVTGGEAAIHFVSDLSSIKDKISERILLLTNKGIKKKDIVIITLSTVEKSVLTPVVTDCQINGVQFTTFRKFKGLEARAVIIVDMDSHIFETALGRKSYYIAASRAKEYLYVLAQIDDEECKRIDRSVFGSDIKNRVILQKRLGLNRF